MRTLTALVLLLGLPVPTAIMAQVVPPAAPPRGQILAAARDVMETARYSTLVTIGPDGQPQARIVDPFAPDSALTIWIGTRPVTRKAADIRRDPRVTLLYFNAPALEYVTVLGTATLVTDSAARAQHWKAEWAAFYPGGPGSDEYLLIRVRPTRLEVVSPRHGLGHDPRTWRPVILDLP